ncbi:dienelactone hydrolase family protein [Streptomyces sp. DG2A-72]|uniref:dienelactone hydrolase family protein n=1 Tax=Streptomyces sp. DG2A-72 TaxID=3051386 RepID=UPI00265B85D5|nr:dienelactone hydrolase family protein [Streptomyces sp. DG2A-72]MDO0932915.1 dienelactone hydrolase family protein [Streptomyces sp. DG2A-72]
MSVISDVVAVPADRLTLPGDFVVPEGARAVVLFAHGVHTPRSHPRIQALAGELQRAGFGTLSMDMFSETEARRAELVQGQPVDLERLGRRLVAAVDWLKAQSDTRALPVVLFAAGAEAAVALRAAADLPDRVLTVISWAGQPELADEVLDRVRTPVLFVTGGHTPEAVPAIRQAADRLEATRELADRVPAPHSVREVRTASHRFDDSDALDRAAEVTQEWIDAHLRSG